MDRIKIYKPPDSPAQAAEFIEGLEPKLRDKLVRQIFYLSQTPLPELKEPHYKHFSIEKYQSLYELREKGRVVVRVIFTPCPNGDYLLLHAFVKRQKRDTEKALEHSLRLLASLWDHPEYAVEYKIREESKTHCTHYPGGHTGVVQCGIFLEKEGPEMKRLLTCLLLAAALVTNACALEVPTDTTVQNLNGSQQLIKTYTLPPGADPQQLIEEPFDQKGWHYTFADIVKEENQVSDRKYHTETVTLETDTKDLGKILEQLATTLDYDDGTYSGVLTLDHTAIRTEASGYTSQAKNITATKTIGPLDRNDMSYVPATTVKDGVTLNLSNVDWQIIGTDLVGDALAPASYQAVATYSGKSYHKVATGYITSADYVGEVTRSDVESVTYKVTYLGTETSGINLLPDRSGVSVAGLPGKVLPYALGILGAGIIATLGVLLFRSRRALRQLQEEPEDESEEEETK